MVRFRAAQLLQDLLKNHTSLSQLRSAFKKESSSERALLQELCFGVARWYFRLELIAQLLLTKPLKAKDGDIQTIILIGLYQLAFMRIPPYAAISETVEVARRYRKEWATGLVNGVLRSYMKKKEHIETAMAANEVARYAHPRWLIDKLKQEWSDWAVILDTNNSRPAMCLRVNRLKTTVPQYLEILASQAIGARAIPNTDYGIILEEPMDISELPGFAEGCVSVQDGAAQLAVQLLAPLPRERVLDACAAPGGKTGHLLEHQPQLAELIAIDNDASRLSKINENLARLGVQAHVFEASITSTNWWDGRGFDRILLDVPCSATGVIRRHPDIKIIRQPKDIAQLRATQLNACKSAWQLLKKGGQLLYVTCSVLPEENDSVISEFMQDHPDCLEIVLDVSWGLPRVHGRQVLPGMHLGMDGFYFALLSKGG